MGYICKKLMEVGEIDVDCKVLIFFLMEEGKIYWFDGDSYWCVMVFILCVKIYEIVNFEYLYYVGVVFGNF